MRILQANLILWREMKEASRREDRRQEARRQEAYLEGDAGGQQEGRQEETGDHGTACRARREKEQCSEGKSRRGLDRGDMLPNSSPLIKNIYQ